jgi:hypothetical protein
MRLCRNKVSVFRISFAYRCLSKEVVYFLFPLRHRIQFRIDYLSGAVKDRSGLLKITKWRPARDAGRQGQSMFDLFSFQVIFVTIATDAVGVIFLVFGADGFILVIEL